MPKPKVSFETKVKMWLKDGSELYQPLKAETLFCRACGKAVSNVDFEVARFSFIFQCFDIYSYEKYISLCSLNVHKSHIWSNMKVEIITGKKFSNPFAKNY